MRDTSEVQVWLVFGKAFAPWQLVRNEREPERYKASVTRSSGC